jgi:antitoxin HicB
MSKTDSRFPFPHPFGAKSGLCECLRLSEPKVALYQAMREGGIRKSDLARKMNLHMPQSDRLLDLGHASKLDQIEAALRVLGKELIFEVRAA